MFWLLALAGPIPLPSFLRLRFLLLPLPVCSSIWILTHVPPTTFADYIAHRLQLHNRSGKARGADVRLRTEKINMDNYDESVSVFPWLRSETGNVEMRSLILLAYFAHSFAQRRGFIEY
jgi:hypothetical protein